ncbi:MAG TPA: KpsF/GutQ family sugar-phosphate isomerase [Vicinamibacterales bacterium]|nr:KpsF/GutQ family sugar-phosphate isomerase [Vicinamibacterales bacterium]
MSDEQDPIELARKVLETEAQAILGLIPQLDASFARAIDLLHGCAGRVIVTGMGKSGIIARKMAATLSSTGTSAIYLNPAEAIHGDLGVVQPADVVVALSQSGETAELVRLLEAIRRLGAKLISLTGRPQSTLGEASDVTLCCHVEEEACPMQLAPTASTTATLALGDAVAMALARRKGFRPEQFADLHPGGHLGKRLMRIDALMHGGRAVPVVRESTAMPEVIHEMSSKRLGMTCVTDQAGRLVGVVTDGDLRRHMTRDGNLIERTAADVMTRTPVTIAGQMLAVEALRLMEQRKITALVVVDADDLVAGVVHLHDLWRTQMI